MCGIQGSKVESSGSEQSEQTGHACVLIWCRFGVDSWSRPSETTRGGRALRRNAKGASPPPETGSLMYVVLEGSTKAWLGRLCNSQGWVHGDRALGNGTRVHLLSTPVPTPPQRHTKGSTIGLTGSRFLSAAADGCSNLALMTCAVSRRRKPHQHTVKGHL